MQKGFASLEIVLAVMIILILAIVAVPNAARIVDKTAVIYEQKRLYSELQFTRTLNRSAKISTEGMNKATGFLPSEVLSSNPVELEIYSKTNSYRIVRGDEIIRREYRLSNDVTVSTDVAKISFDSSGYSTVKSATIVLTSRQGDTSKIRIDSVGRIRGDNENY